MRTANRISRRHPTLINFIFIIIMAFCTRYLGTAVRIQRKNSTKFINTQLHSSHAGISEVSEIDIRNPAHTKSIIENFLSFAPPLPAADVIRILKAAVEQNKLLPNVIRLKVPELDQSTSPVSVDTAIDGTILDNSNSNSNKDISTPIKFGNFSICGDTHGQYFDVMNIFTDKVGGFPSKSNVYLFNGDYVDRGKYSVEIVLTLISIKLSDPTAMHMLRGNHESISMTSNFGFQTEVRTKYKNDFSAVFPWFLEFFNSLPIAAVVEDQGNFILFYFILLVF